MNILHKAEAARQDRKMALMPEKGGLYHSGYDDLVAYGQKIGGEQSPVLEITGPLSRHGECNLGYETMMGFIKVAAEDPEIHTIGIKIDTPGGNVDGVKGVADAINYAKKKGKRVSVWGGFIASAGVFIASQASEIFMDDQKVSEYGSIGVLRIMVNEKERLEKEGIKVDIVRAPGSENKARLNSIEDVPEEVMAAELQFLAELRKEFVGYVRRGRSGKLTSSEWEAADMFNNTNAQRIGLIDGAMGLNEWLNHIKSI